MFSPLKKIWNRHRVLVIILGLVVVAGLTFGAVRFSRAVPLIPTAIVQRGEFVEVVQFRGHVTAQKSIQLKAPSVAGDIQIIKLARTGTAVKKGDVVAQFDTSKLLDTLNQRRSDMKQADAEIGQERAKAHLLEEQDRTDLLKAHYDVERAKLDVSQQEILSPIDAAEKKLLLADAEQKLREIESRQKSDQTSSQALINAKVQTRAKALADVNRVEANIASMTLRAPTEGVVTLFPNWRAGGFFSDNPPEFRQGDRAWHGASIAELPDYSTLQVNTRIDEVDRGRMQVGQTATIRVDAVPDHEFTAHIVQISALAKTDFTTWPPPRNFDVTLELDTKDPRLRPGMSGSGRIAVNRVPGSILIPATAIFSQAGAPLVYILTGTKFAPRPVVVGFRNEEQLAITSGLAVGEKVALKDPAVVVDKP
ncbi:MAG: efflux RND transporter periplasmic adaptor subunit [Acidobacteriota bacterium]|nr:efflux RND transporter periplasmic adaptor subunit [Acidobacteriota bacterium]